MKNPAISVIMPVYNAQRYLKEAIESVLKQTFEDFEFLIVDDGSTDASEKIVRSFDDPRIVYVKNERNLGIAKSLYRGVELARGEYIARMDADDICMPQRLERQLKYFATYPETDLLFTEIEFVDFQGEECGEWPVDRACSTHEEIVSVLPRQNCLAHPTLMVRRSLLQKHPYDSRAFASEDYNLWLRLAAEGYRFAKIPEPLLKYRIHSTSLTFESGRNVLKKYRKLLSAKLTFLLERASGPDRNDFDREVAKRFFRETGNFFKDLLKPSLRSLFLHMGTFLWYLFPRRFSHKILFFSKNADMGGVEKVQLDLLESVRNFDVLVIFGQRSLTRHFEHEYRTLAKVIDYSKFSGFLPGRWLMAGYLSKAVRSSRPKAVFGSFCGLYYDMLRLPKSCGTEYIDLFHAFDGNIEYFFLDVIPKLDTRVVIDESIKKELENFYRRYGYGKWVHRLHVIRNGVYVPWKLPAKPQNSRLNLLFVGRNAPVKRVHLIKELAKKLPQCDFHLVGVDPVKDDPDNLSAHGAVANVAPFYEKADVFLLVSSREGLPLTLMEAMSFGVVPVSTAVGGIPSHIEEGRNGFLVYEKEEENIVSTIADIVERLDVDRGTLERISITAHRYALEHFDIEAMKSAYRALFEKAVNEK